MEQSFFGHGVFCLDASALAKRYVPEVNANDTIILRVSIDVRQHLHSGADDLALVASDQRLLRAAQAEGLVTFNPETQDQASLATLVGP